MTGDAQLERWAVDTLATVRGLRRPIVELDTDGCKHRGLIHPDEWRAMREPGLRRRLLVEAPKGRHRGTPKGTR